MKLSVSLAIASGLAVMAMPAASVYEPRAADFVTWPEASCQDSATNVRTEHHDIESDKCYSLPGARFTLWNTARPSCKLTVYESSTDCTGASQTFQIPPDRGVCKDISRFHTYKVVC